MPLDEFIEECYGKLNQGLEWVPVGEAFPQGPKEYEQLVANREKVFGKLSEILMAYPM